MDHVSMKSGLEGRNNIPDATLLDDELIVSMKSGLEGRNNETREVREFAAKKASQ